MRNLNGRGFGSISRLEAPPNTHYPLRKAQL
nr:MAG TPA: hypothetical protein [Caudoviricetes sp.]